MFVCWEMLLSWQRWPDFWFYALPLFPVQEDFLWWERQTGGDGIIKRPDGDSCGTQQCHTDKCQREQSVIDRGNLSPTQNIVCSSSSIKWETLQEFWFPVPLSAYIKTTLQLVTAHSDCAPFLVSFTQCLLWHQRVILGHKRFILFFYYYSI